MKKVFIIILNWNKWKDTIECLYSVYKSDYLNYEILLIDNGSSDRSVEIIKSSFPDLRVIINRENIGFTGGNNQGMRIAVSEGADYVWLLNNDTEIEPDCLSKIVAAAEGSDRIGLVSPAICYYNAPSIHQFRGSIVDWNNFEIIYRNENNYNLNFLDGDSVCLWGTALLINVSLVKKIGFLNDDYFAYYEDTAFSLKSLQSGFHNIYCCDAKIYHKHDYCDNKTVIKEHYYYYYMIRNEYLLWKDILNFKFDKNIFKRVALKAISRSKNFEKLNLYLHMRVTIQALYDAILNKRGRLVVNKNINLYLVRFFLKHPYVILNILLCDFDAIFKQVKLKFNFLLYKY